MRNIDIRIAREDISFLGWRVGMQRRLARHALALLPRADGGDAACARRNSRHQRVADEKRRQEIEQKQQTEMHLNNQREQHLA